MAKSNTAKPDTAKTNAKSQNAVPSSESSTASKTRNAAKNPKTSTELTTQGEQVIKKKRPSNGKNSPVIGENGYLFKDEEEKRAYVSKTLAECLEIYRLPPVKTDDELMERIEQYFERCVTRGIKPTVEELYMATGHPRSTVYDWETGKTRGLGVLTSAVIKKAKEYLANFDAKMVVDGKLNPVTYMFRSKNYYGMRDQQEYVLTPTAPLGTEDAAAAEKLLEDLPE